MDKKDYSKKELISVLKRFVITAKKHNFIGAACDVWGVDAGTTDFHMDVVYDVYNYLYGGDMDMESTACTTGKSLANHGVDGRNASTGLGIYYIIREICDKEASYKHIRKQARLLRGIEKKKVVLQGFGNVGYWSAKTLYDNGALITGVAVDFCSVINQAGMNPDEILDAMKDYKQTGSDLALKKLGEVTWDDSAIYQRCDILIPAAVEMSIHEGNVHRIQAKMIVEAANGAISFKADKFLAKKNVVVIPDVLAGTGGLISSYFEFLSNLDRRKQHDLITKWEEKSKLSMLMMIENVFDKAKFDIHFSNELKGGYLEGPQEKDLHDGTIESIIIDALEKVTRISKEKEISLRNACYNIALHKINDGVDNTGMTI